MLENTIQIDSFLEELKTAVLGSVIKREKLAAKYETLESRRNASQYITMIEAGDSWSAYIQFDTDILLSVGISADMITYYTLDKERIPYTLRNRIMQLQKEKIINNYVELNDYYRMLAGLPSLEEIENEDFVYCPENDFGIPTDVPVHQLTLDHSNYLRGSTLLDQIIAAHPDKKYLKFLGSFAIDFYTSRTAPNYQLLYAPPTKLESIYLDFMRMYDRARNFFIVGIYNKEYSKMYEYYDEFIGLCIMTMAINRTITNMYKQGIAREFYDTKLIQYLFSSYSIPYITDMHIKYQRILAKNLNLLLSYKATNKVLYDIVNMFEMININIYKYYLVKEHVFSETGKPYFPEKEEIDEVTGEPTGKMIPDYEKMYTFHFQKINLKEKDKVVALSNIENEINYITLTVEDPYWFNDEALYKKLYETKFNHIVTKYMSLDAIFKIFEMMYECCHTVRMIIDKQEDFKRLEISSAQISSEPVNLFDLVILLCALGAKKLKLDGRIPMIGYQIANVYGFNFHTDLEKIRTDIMEDKDHYKYIDDEVLTILTKMNAPTLDDVAKLYNKIKAFKDFVVDAMYHTKNNDVFHAYNKLYRSLLVVEDKEKVYQKPNGAGTAATYYELLKSLRPELVNIVDKLNTEDEIDVMLNHIFSRIAMLNDDYKFLATYNENALLIEIILKLIRFFKSYTVDFVNSGIIFQFDDPYFCALKVMDYCMIGLELFLDDKPGLNFVYNDIIFEAKAKVWYRNYLRLFDRYAIDPSIVFDDKDRNHLFLFHKLLDPTANIDIKDDVVNLVYNDIMTSDTDVSGNDKMTVKDDVFKSAVFKYDGDDHNNHINLLYKQTNSDSDISIDDKSMSGFTYVNTSAKDVKLSGHKVGLNHELKMDVTNY